MLLSYQKPLNGDVGIVFGSFAPMHQGHLELIMRAKKENKGGCIVIVCGYKGDKGESKLNHLKRYRYARQMFEDDELVSVYAINDDDINIEHYPNGWYGWMREFERIFCAAVKDPSCKRTWYVGDKQYYTDLIEMFGENAVLVERSANPISATMIRENPMKHWDKIARTFKSSYSTNILITGTASEGKSTLVKDLGKYFNAPCSYEWARDYIIKHGKNDWEFTTQDFLAFLHGQFELNRQLIKSTGNNGIFFADSDSLVTNMYAQSYCNEHGFSLREDEYENIIKPASYMYARMCRWDAIFCLAPHGTFIDDHTRYMGHSELSERNKLFDTLVASMKDVGMWDKVVILDGNYYENFNKVVEYVNKIKSN